MRVFVTGATGYIGFAVATAFRRCGHRVTGLIRSDKNSPLLRAHEIIPFLGDLANPKTFMEEMEQAEVIVHCGFDMESKDGVKMDYNLIKAVVKLGQRSKTPKQFIYTSGVWVVGNTHCKADESTPLNPLSIVKWRPSHEEAVLEGASGPFKTLVLRPGCVYGGKGGLTSLFFSSAKKGVLEVIGNGDNVWALIHVEDLAEAYVKAAEKELTGISLNLTDGSRVKIKEIAESISKQTPCSINFLSQSEGVKQLGTLTEGLLANQIISNERARRLLNWQPKHHFLDDIDIYARAIG